MATTAAVTTRRDSHGHMGLTKDVAGELTKSYQYSPCMYASACWHTGPAGAGIDPRQVGDLYRADEVRRVFPAVRQLCDVGARTVTDAQELLRRAGWTSNRRVEAEGMLEALAQAGHTVVDRAGQFLSEFSGDRKSVV